VSDNLKEKITKLVNQLDAEVQHAERLLDMYQENADLSNFVKNTSNIVEKLVNVVSQLPDDK
jgi:hypothetical protein